MAHKLSPNRIRNGGWLSQLFGGSLPRETRTLQRKAQRGGGDPLHDVVARVFADVSTTLPLRQELETAISAIVALEAAAFTVPDAQASPANAGFNGYGTRQRARAVIDFNRQREARISEWVEGLRQLVATISKAAPRPSNDPGVVTFHVPLIALLKQPATVVSEIMAQVLAWSSEDTTTISLGSALARKLERNWLELSNLNRADAKRRPERLTKPDASRPGQELVESYLAATPLADLLKTAVPLKIALKKFYLSTHVAAAIGAGKTAGILQYLISQFLAQDELPSLLILDHQGRSELIDKVIRQRCFAPGGKHEDRLIIVDPLDKAFPISFNPFALRTGDADPEIGISKAIDLLKFVFASCLSADLTSRQTTLFGYVARLMAEIEGANIKTFIDILANPERYSQQMQRLTGPAAEFFEIDFYDKKSYGDCKNELRRRLMGILENPALERMLCASRSSFDIGDELQKGRVILVDTNRADLTAERSLIISRMITAMALAGMFARHSIPEPQRRPAFVIADEFAEMADTSLLTWISQCRRYHAGTILAHQFFRQIKSGEFRAGLAGQVGIKLFGRLSDEDAREASREMKCAPALFTSLQAGDATRPAEFALYVRGETDAAVKINVPMMSLDRSPQMSSAEFAVVCQQIRERYGAPPASSARSSAPLLASIPRVLASTPTKAGKRPTRPVAAPGTDAGSDVDAYLRSGE